MALIKGLDAQRDFAAGQLDPTIKRNDEDPRLKIGGRQMANFRIQTTKSLKNRPGRTIRLLETATSRTDKVIMSPGNIFYLTFGTAGGGYLKVYNAAGAQVFTQSTFPWTPATIQMIVWDIYQLSIYITFPGMQPLVLTWDGVSVWSLANYTEALHSNQKRTFFYRIAPRNITMLPSATTGSITITFNAPVLTAGMVGTRFRFTGNQILMTAFTDSQHGTFTVQETLPPTQEFSPLTNISGFFNVGDLVQGSSSHAQGIVTQYILNSALFIQLLSGSVQFNTGDTIVGINGTATTSAISNLAPTAIAVWDQEVMNAFRGWPSSVFVDQNRLGFGNFPSVPGAVGWSAIGNTTDLYVDATPDNAIFELVPGKNQVLFVVPGMEGSEFVFCDNAIFYIPISETNPLKPGSVAFNLITRNGINPNVKPIALKEHIVYVGQSVSPNPNLPPVVPVYAIVATGSLTRPNESLPLSDVATAVFNNPLAIAVPNADSTYPERYVYVLNGDGTVAVGRYEIKSGTIVGSGSGTVGWTPWSGVGSVKWMFSLAADVIFSTQYPGATYLVEALDDAQFLDGALSYNALPASIVPPGGKGPLFWIPGGNVYVLDLGTRQMGTYAVDANGFLIPQFQGGENLTSSQLIVGFPWTATFEPFIPGAQPGQDVQQRTKKRKVSKHTVYVEQSSGFLFARLFSGPHTQTSPASGSIIGSRRITTYNQDDDPTLAPPLREQAYFWRPIGRAHDPRIAIIKDTPGPLIIVESNVEVTA